MMKTMARKISRSMVSAITIADLAKNTLPGSVSLNDSLGFATTCYESGMIDVLRGVAMEDMEYGVGYVELTPKLEKDLKEMEKRSKEVERFLNEDQLRFFDEFIESANNVRNSDAEENYIQGFLRGYRYLKNQMEFRGGCGQ